MEDAGTSEEDNIDSQDSNIPINWPSSPELFNKDNIFLYCMVVELRFSLEGGIDVKGVREWA